MIVTINTKSKADIFDNSNISYYHHQITNINLLYLPIYTYYILNIKQFLYFSYI